MRFSDVAFMTSLPLADMPKVKQALTQEWLEPFRPVRQRTVRSETTKEKAGALPPSVYMREPSVYFLYIRRKGLRHKPYQLQKRRLQQ